MVHILTFVLFRLIAVTNKPKEVNDSNTIEFSVFFLKKKFQGVLERGGGGSCSLVILGSSQVRALPSLIPGFQYYLGEKRS